MRLFADRGLCVGSGMCVLTAPGVFDQDDEDGLVVVHGDPDGRGDAAALGRVVDACPSGAITFMP
ncbi:ferredoxin [Nocardiopsis sp. CNR-923]|uniref:ferredoxin n=1 Tax=Nocardiopsis sp. CNR-923 TaxID=1904965 RepID=UPI00095A39A0|nr:ferredoxin [Nocardiopsis sp. CNR-923]OLT29766.1 ferredoxin [Nocardiopsis sp. CNR-923]